MPDALRDQFALARDACDALSIPWRDREGYEADDLIGTYAQEAARAAKVIIFSPDKDHLQLVSDRVRMLTPQAVKEKEAKRLSEADAMDPTAVEAKFGVRPMQIGDYLALVGDQVDGLPGVPGIGQKTAAALLRAHADLDGIVGAARDGGLRGVRRSIVPSILEQEAQLRLVRSLVELRVVEGMEAGGWRMDFALPVHDEAWLERALAFCSRQGFRKLARMIKKEAQSSTPSE